MTSSFKLCITLYQMYYCRGNIRYHYCYTSFCPSPCFISKGVTFPAMMAMWARWAPPLERSRLMTLSGSGANFGAFLALPLTGYICQTLGWPAVFYICGEARERTQTQIQSHTHTHHNTLQSLSGNMPGW